MAGGFEVGDFLRIYCEKESNPYWEKGHAMFKALDPFAREGNLVWVIDEASPVRMSPGKNSRPNQYLKVRLTNPENLNSEVFTYLNEGEEHQIDKGDPITSSGWLLYYNDAIYYLPENSQDFIRQFDKILLEAPERKTNWKVEKFSYGGRIPKHGETPEQNEVKQIIEFLEAIWEEEKENFLRGGTENRHHKRIFMRSFWDDGLFGNRFMSATPPIAEAFDLVEGTPLYKNIYKYTHSQELDEGFSLPTTGGGRKKRRKRRKTKTKKSKRKSKRSSKKRKYKNK
jgi:hypothetical protein